MISANNIIGVLDYGIGNSAVLLNVMRYLGFEAQLVMTPNELSSVNKIILPGVGAFDSGIAGLHSANFFSSLKDLAGSGLDVLGICLGAQMLLEGSEEGTSLGLGLIPGQSKRFPKENAFSVPVTGKCGVKFSNKKKYSKFNKEKFYFVHAFHMHVNNNNMFAQNSEIKIDDRQCTAGIYHKNIMGVQFHPERSGKVGVEFLRTWAEV